LCKELWLLHSAVGSQCTCKVVNDALWGMRPICNHCRKCVITAFSKWDAVETVTYTVHTPACHNLSH
ncbi:hypothetical protein GYMLUDRAFT_183528, partial [Collybiopsis luxurians FD-317 M1]